jgi:ribose 5-phosphate isomerase A
VTQFAWRHHARLLGNLGCTPALRGGEDNPYVTDNHNFILDCTFPDGIDDPAKLDKTLNNQPGIVGHGLFLNMANEVIVAGEDGIKVIRK